MPGAGYRHFAEHEDTLLRRWSDEGMPASEIAKLLGRDLSTVARRMKRVDEGGDPLHAGRPYILTHEKEEKIVVAAEELIQLADGEWQVTAGVIKKALKLKCCDRTVLDALHRHNIYFRTMRQKPVLTTTDIEERLAFANKYVGNPISFWTSSVDAYMDNKFFPVYLSAKARAYARKLRPRGTFRAPGQGFGRGHVKPRKDLKQNFGHNVHVSVAISATKVLTCHVVDGTWNKESAAAMYTDVLGPSLQRAHPTKRSFFLLEDNDPAGYKSGLAKQAKRDLGVRVLELPKRSPDLNPLDFSFWSGVNTRLRNQELRFDDDYNESRVCFIKRLRRTILRTPRRALLAMVRNMKRRCEKLKGAAGMHFEEGS